MIAEFNFSDKQKNILADIYQEAFPPEERRPTEHFFALAAMPDVPFHILVSHDADGAVTGFISYWEFSEFIYVEHFAIHPDLRGGGTGRRALDEFMALQKLPVVLEVERPGSNDMAVRRIGFYRRARFHTIDTYDYIQPPYAPGLPEVPLLLMCDRPAEIDPARVDATLRDEVYGYRKNFK